MRLIIVLTLSLVKCNLAFLRSNYLKKNLRLTDVGIFISNDRGAPLFECKNITSELSSNTSCQHVLTEIKGQLFEHLNCFLRLLKEEHCEDLVCLNAEVVRCAVELMDFIIRQNDERNCHGNILTRHILSGFRGTEMLVRNISEIRATWMNKLTSCKSGTFVECLWSMEDLMPILKDQVEELFERLARSKQCQVFVQGCCMINKYFGGLKSNLKSDKCFALNEDIYDFISFMSVCMGSLGNINNLSNIAIVKKSDDFKICGLDVGAVR